MQINYDRTLGTLTLSHERAIKAMLLQYGLEAGQVRTMSTPEAITRSQEQLYDASEEKEEALSRSANDRDGSVTFSNFRSLVGSLLYFANSTRPDISHAVGILCRHVTDPPYDMLVKAKRVLRYLCCTPALGIRFSRSGRQTPYAFSDADWAKDQKDSKSTSGTLLKLADGPVMWGSKKQTTVSLPLSLSMSQPQKSARTSSGSALCSKASAFRSKAPVLCTLTIVQLSTRLGQKGTRADSVTFSLAITSSRISL